MSDEAKNQSDATESSTRRDEEPVVAEVALSQPARRRSAWKSFLFVFKAVEIRLRFILILVAVGLVIGYWETIKNYWDKWTRPPAGAVGAVGADSEFYCPMHPKVVRDTLETDGSVPKCPICGMPLSKRKKGELPKLPEGVMSRVQFSPQRIQLAGIQTVEVERRPLMREIRTVGYVTVDESRLSRIVTRFDGYIEKLYVNKSFQDVAENEPLAEVYSPKLYTAVQELLIAKESKNETLTDIGREKLRLLGIDRREIDEIVKTDKADYRLIIRSPITGHVFRKEVVEGDKVMSGMMLFEVADVSSVWIEAEVYEKDVPLIQVGQSIRATVEAYPDREFTGKVSLIHPHMEMQTRTNRVRFEIDNPGHVLRPGMYATVHLKTPVQQLEPFKSILVADQQRLESNDDESLIAHQKVCPVTGFKLGSMGKPIRASIGEHPLMLCCASCTSDIEERPDYFLSRLHPITAEGVPAVPERSVIDTGDLKVVYVERDPGVFEGVEVKIGPRSGGYYAVIEGVLPGDRVAAAGSFLVDAETRLNPAAAATYFGASGGPQQHQHGPAPATRESTPSESPSSVPRQPSQKDLANIQKLPPADREAALRQKTCPATGLPLGSMGVPIKITVDGRSFFICCDHCTERANAESDRVLKQLNQNR